MQIISVFLKYVWQSKIRHLSFDSSLTEFIFLVCTIPLALGINNAILIATLFFGLVSFNKVHLNASYGLVVPVLFFFWTCASYWWSIDQEATLKAIPKGLVMLLIPFLFFIKKPFSTDQKEKVLKLYSYAMLGYVLYYLVRALIRFLISGDTAVFFYHELVTLDVNAIHVSVYVSMAYFYFLKQKHNSVYNRLIVGVLFTFLLLLSSKNIILITLVMSLLYVGNQRLSRKMVLIYAVVGLVILSVFSVKLMARFQDENFSDESKTLENGVHVVTPYQAWNQQKFTPNDYFPGTAFRVYQLRVFWDLLQEEPIFWKGFGLNASYSKQFDKAVEYQVFTGNENNRGYHAKNFHNQYIQAFSDLGFIGFILVLGMVIINLRNGIKDKEFLHIIFAILMISLFLTETFLWRQRGMVFFVSFYCFFNHSKKLSL